MINDDWHILKNMIEETLGLEELGIILSGLLEGRNTMIKLVLLDQMMKATMW